MMLRLSSSGQKETNPQDLSCSKCVDTVEVDTSHIKNVLHVVFTARSAVNETTLLECADQEAEDLSTQGT